jgi:hypothetical protein
MMILPKTEGAENSRAALSSLYMGTSRPELAISQLLSNLDAPGAAGNKYLLVQTTESGFSSKPALQPEGKNRSLKMCSSEIPKERAVSVAASINGGGPHR